MSNRYTRTIYNKLGFETAKILDLTKLGPEYTGRSLDIDNMNGNSAIFCMFKQGLP